MYISDMWLERNLYDSDDIDIGCTWIDDFGWLHRVQLSLEFLDGAYHLPPQAMDLPVEVQQALEKRLQFITAPGRSRRQP